MDHISRPKLKKERIKIGHIPTVIYGEASDQLYIFVHGKCGFKEEAEAFAEVVCTNGYQVLTIDLPGHGERKKEMDSFVPWKIVPELKSVIKYGKENWNQISLRANSIGAWLSMQAFHNEKLGRALFVSPILDMEKLIEDMMEWAAVTEKDLEEQKIIPTNFGETLNWEYYQYAKLHPVVNWKVPTALLYGSKENLTSRHTVDNFVNDFSCELTVMEDGDHWFHTPEQLEVLSQWERDNISGNKTTNGECH